MLPPEAVSVPVCTTLKDIHCGLTSPVPPVRVPSLDRLRDISMENELVPVATVVLDCFVDSLSPGY